MGFYGLGPMKKQEVYCREWQLMPLIISWFVVRYYFLCDLASEGKQNGDENLHFMVVKYRRENFQVGLKLCRDQDVSGCNGAQ